MVINQHNENIINLDFRSLDDKALLENYGLNEDFFNEDEKFILNKNLDDKKNLTLENSYIERIQYGDHQTPLYFTDKIVEFIKQSEDSFDYIIEPTLGIGNFLLSAFKFYKDSKFIGIEIQKKYISYFKLQILNRLISSENKIKSIELYNSNIFNFDFTKIKEKIKDKKILLIGNPPWVTNSYLSSINSFNLPAKTNLNKNKGLDAVTGKSNFDIAESILMKLIKEFADFNCRLAFLCKNIVVKNIIKKESNKTTLSNIKIFNIDSKRIFNVSADACLFTAELGNRKEESAKVYDFQYPNKMIKKFGWIENSFVSDIDKYKRFRKYDSNSDFIWRQGLKHDSSKIMELKIEEGSLINGFGEKLKFDNEFMYGLLKSSDLRKKIIHKPRKAVIVTQKRTGEDTEIISEKSPELWEYLIRNGEYLDKRKSSIYRNRPRFSIFGIGEYSFSKYKAAVSGLYKEINFSLVMPYMNKPVMLDDTCYFIGFDDFSYAFLTVMLLNQDSVKEFIKSIAFLNSKRPYTKEILMRISLSDISNDFSYNQIMESAGEEFYDLNKITEDDYNRYKKFLMKNRSVT